MKKFITIALLTLGITSGVFAAQGSNHCAPVSFAVPGPGPGTSTVNQNEFVVLVIEAA
jgi:hypothetical protein